MAVGKEIIKMELSNISTKELVDELVKREAVEKIIVEPYQEYKIVIGNNEISDDGPMTILQVWD